MKPLFSAWSALTIAVAMTHPALAQQPAPNPTAMTASDLIANQIGQLTIQNANLAEQLTRANATIEALKKQIEMLQKAAAAPTEKKE